jgi:dTDP-4-dehydrorhamnose 3,5-epimerase
MRFLETEIPGVILVEPQVHSDTRGFFVETYHVPRYREGGIDAVFVQDNHSQSTRGTLRGLHGQFPRCQGKLLRVIQGEVFDVAVDVRQYKCTDVYRPEDEIGVAWNDPDLGIAWPVDDPILSPKDRDAPRLRDVQQQLIEF